MKSPWKLLGQLISRRDAQVENAEQLASDEATERLDAEKLEDHVPGSIDGSLSSPVKTNDAEADSGALSVEENTKSHQVSDVGDSVDHQPQPVARKPRQSGAARTGAAAKPQTRGSVNLEHVRGKTLARLGSKSVPSSRRFESEAEEQHVTAAGPGFVSNAVELDSEIKLLRHQLAELLRKQNEQLRAMNARFDRS